MSCSTAPPAALAPQVAEVLAGPAQVRLLPLAHPAGEQSLRQRAPDDGAQAVALGHGQHVALDAPVQDRVRRLLAPEPHEAAALGDPLRLDHIDGRELGGSDRPHLAAVHQVGQRRQRLLHIGLRVGPVVLVQVDVVGLQPPQRVLDLGDDPPARRAPPVRGLAHGIGELRREHHVVPAALQRLADDFFGLTGGVHVGRVDQVDAGLERFADDADRVVVVAVAEGAEHHGAESVRADLDARAAEGAVAHRRSPSGARRVPYCKEQ
jgi:hypothetical protein